MFESFEIRFFNFLCGEYGIRFGRTLIKYCRFPTFRQIFILNKYPPGREKNIKITIGRHNKGGGRVTIFPASIKIVYFDDRFLFFFFFCTLSANISILFSRNVHSNNNIEPIPSLTIPAKRTDGRAYVSRVFAFSPPVLTRRSEKNTSFDIHIQLNISTTLRVR